MDKITQIANSLRPERICSIDASTNSFAFAIFNGNKIEKYGKINFSGKTNYDKVVDAARKCIGVFKLFEVDAIVIEHTVYMNSPKTAADLALVQGAILGSAGINKVKVAGSINPITWQTYIGNGKLKAEDKKKIIDDNPGKSKSFYKKLERELRKSKTINFVNTYYDLSLSDDDVADAVGVGHYAIHNWSKIKKD